MEKNIGLCNVPLHILIKQCSLGKKTPEEIYNDLSLMNRELIHKVFAYRKFNYDFADHMSTYTNGKDLITNIRPCYEDFLYSLLKFLDIHGKPTDKVIDNEDLTKVMKDRVEVLKGIKTETELKNNFPIIFQDYIQGKAYIDSFDKNDKSTEEEQKYYYRCALMKNFDKFIERQVELYTRFIERRNDLHLLMRETSYNDYFKENFDMDKVHMLMADQGIRICSNTDDLITINKHIKPLMNYRTDESFKKSYTLRNINGEEVTDYNNEVRIISINSRAVDMRTVKTDWTIAKSSKATKSKNTKPRTMTINLEEINRLKEIGRKKKEFYKENTPVYIITGIEGYNGYVARVYENAEVILDREYDESHPYTATGAAIHNFKIWDFEKLSKLDTAKLKNHPDSNWIQHREGWEQKVEDIINRDATQEEREEVRKYIKKKKGKQ